MSLFPMWKRDVIQRDELTLLHLLEQLATSLTMSHVLRSLMSRLYNPFNWTIVLEPKAWAAGCGRTTAHRRIGTTSGRPCSRPFAAAPFLRRSGRIVDSAWAFGESRGSHWTGWGVQTTGFNLGCNEEGQPTPVTTG